MKLQTLLKTYYFKASPYYIMDALWTMKIQNFVIVFASKASKHSIFNCVTFASLVHVI